MSQPKFPSRLKQDGLTLIELLVSLVIGLLLAIVASSTYLYSKQAYNAVSENSQMEENGRFAINLLTKNIQSAGHVLLNKSLATPEPMAEKIFGCEFGMSNPAGATSQADLKTCLASLPAGVTQSSSISTFYQTDGFNTTGASYQGVDCLGNRPVQIVSTTPSGATVTAWEVRSHFFISYTTAGTPYGTTTMGQLSCATDPTGGATPGVFASQPLIPGVHQLRARYYLPTVDNDVAPAGRLKEAGSMAADEWQQVVQVELCVLTKAIQTSGNDTATQVTDCYDNNFTPPPSQSYRRFMSTVSLRNRSGKAG